jgi:hypothetical protein
VLLGGPGADVSTGSGGVGSRDGAGVGVAPAWLETGPRTLGLTAGGLAGGGESASGPEALALGAAFATGPPGSPNDGVKPNQAAVPPTTRASPITTRRTVGKKVGRIGRTVAAPYRAVRPGTIRR